MDLLNGLMMVIVYLIKTASGFLAIVAFIAFVILFAVRSVVDLPEMRKKRISGLTKSINFIWQGTSEYGQRLLIAAVTACIACLTLFIGSGAVIADSQAKAKARHAQVEAERIERERNERKIREELNFSTDPDRLAKLILAGNNCTDVVASFHEVEGSRAISVDYKVKLIGGFFNDVQKADFDKSVIKLTPFLLNRFPDVGEIAISANTLFNDKRGHSYSGNVLSVTFTRENASTINWKGFDYMDVDDVADLYYIHPSLK